MGDILHALPAVTALRMAHPGWIIDWVVEPKWHALLTASSQAPVLTGRSELYQPLVDHIHFAPSKEWRRHPFSARTFSEIKTLRRSLRAGDYDTVIDFQGALRSAALGWMAGCRRRVGEAEPRERLARWLFHERVETHGAHVIEQDLELAAAVAGDELAYAQPKLPTNPFAEEWANEGVFPATGGPSALINPGAGWGAKR